MKKIKIIMVILVIISSILLIANYSNAATDTSEKTVTSEKIVTSTNGSVDYIIKNLELEDGASYQWAIEKSKEAEIVNWYDVTAPEYSTGNIRITISSGNSNQLAVLKSTDSAYITVRKVGEKTNILENYKVDLTLPLLKAFTVTKSGLYTESLGSSGCAYEITSAYNIKASNISFKWEKITDADIVNNYIDNNHDLSGLKLKGKESFPSLSDTSWKSVRLSYSDSYKPELGEILNNEKPAENGLYYLWLKGSADDTKTIYGYVILEIGEVNKIDKNSSDKDGQNNDNDNSNSDSKNDNSNNSSKNDNQQKSDNNKNTNISATNKDQTTAQGILPKTGIGFGLVVIIISLLGIGVFTYSKYNNLKDVK